MLKSLRAALLRYIIKCQTARRNEAELDARHYRERARDAAAKRRDAQARIEDAQREIESIQRRMTVRRIERARPC